MSKKRDKRIARRIHQGYAPRGPRTVSEHNRANTLEQAMQAVMAGTMTYREFCYLAMELERGRDGRTY